MGLFGGRKHRSPCEQLVLLRFLLTPVPGSLCWMRSTQLCPPLLPSLAKHRAEDLRHLQTPRGCRAPLAQRAPAGWQGQGTPMEITAPDCGVLTIKRFVWRSGSSPVQTKYLPGRILPAKIYGGKKRSLRFGFETRLT